MLLRLIDRLLGITPRDPADRTTDFHDPAADAIYATRFVPWDTRMDAMVQFCGNPADPGNPSSWVAPEYPGHPGLHASDVIVRPVGPPCRGGHSRDGVYFAWREVEAVVTYRRAGVALAA